MGVINPNGVNSAKELREASVVKDETNWGYIICSPSKNRTLAMVKKWLGVFFGSSLLLIAVGFWLMPGSLLSRDIVSFKLALSSMIAIFGVTLLWYMLQGKKYEIQVNLERNILREVLRKSNGSTQVLNQIDFDEISDVFIDKTPARNAKSSLLICLKDNPKAIEIVCDYEEHLVRIRNRLGRDILGEKESLLNEANRGSARVDTPSEDDTDKVD